jgi:shikimate 5-dehydrogenase
MAKVSGPRQPTARQLARQVSAEGKNPKSEASEEPPKPKKIGVLISETPVCMDTIERLANEKRQHMVRICLNVCIMLMAKHGTGAHRAL